MMTNLTPEVNQALTRLKELTPLNIHLLTDAGFGLRVNFESVWTNHCPQAARYMLLPYYFLDDYPYGKLNFKEDLG